jgi:hypothetical protein
VKPQIKVILGGILAVLVFDALASIASQSFGFAYASASIGSYLIYLGIGYFAARHASARPLAAGALAAAVAGLADASLGWMISSALGAGSLPAGVRLTATRWIGTALVVVVLAAAVGALGGVVGRRRTEIGAPAA